jgi:hypothetical protein
LYFAKLITIADWLISVTPARLIDKRRNVNYRRLTHLPFYLFLLYFLTYLLCCSRVFRFIVFMLFVSYRPIGSGVYYCLSLICLFIACMFTYDTLIRYLLLTYLLTYLLNPTGTYVQYRKPDAKRSIAPQN